MSETITQTVGTGYVTTLQGVCKVVEVVGSFIAILLVGIDFWGSTISFFESAAAMSIIGSAILLILYLSAAVEKITWPWNRIQFFYHIILAIYYLIAVALVFNRGSHFSRIIAGGVFGLIALIAHLLDGFDNYRKQPLF